MRRDKVERRVSVNTELLVLSGALGVGYAVGRRINDLEKAHEIALEVKSDICNIDIKKILDEDLLKELSDIRNRVDELISSHDERSISNTLKFWKIDHKFELRDALRLKKDCNILMSRINKKEL